MTTNILSQAYHLIRKDLKLEWRQKYAISGILLYLIAVVFTVFLAFEEMDSFTWVALFWIIILFTAVNALAKSFIQESDKRNLYYYTIAHPQAVILAKMTYNILLMILLSSLAILFYSIVAGYPIRGNASFLLALFLGGIAMAEIFSMIAAIASHASNTGTLMTILSFPILLPLIRILVDISQKAVLRNELAAEMDSLLLLLATDILIIALSLILFPYLWRD